LALLKGLPSLRDLEFGSLMCGTKIGECHTHQEIPPHELQALHFSMIPRNYFGTTTVVYHICPRARHLMWTACSNLTKLSLWGSCAPSFLEMIPDYCKKLESIRFEPHAFESSDIVEGLNDELLKKLSSLPLKCFTLNVKPRISDEHLIPFLQTSTKLEILMLPGPLVTDKLLYALNGNSAIKEFTVDIENTSASSPMTDCALSQLQMPNLERFKIINEIPFITMQALEFVKNCPKLLLLGISGQSLPSEALRFVAHYAVKISRLRVLIKEPKDEDIIEVLESSSIHRLTLDLMNEPKTRLDALQSRYPGRLDVFSW